jgi:hypothetical protein
MSDGAGFAHKLSIAVRKWGPDKNPEADEPDEVLVRESWHEADGAEVTDPARIAELEAKV